MKSLLKLTVAAAAMLGAGMFASAPASARTDFSVSIGVPNAVGYDYNSGGYCDAGGCPDAYWDYPVWYGPVFIRGEWYRGPVYFREGRDGRRLFWIRGAWRNDEWYGPRPGWWDRGHYYAGPALGYSFYLGHGFRHDRDRYWRGNDWRPGREWRGRDWHDRGSINVYIGGDGRHHDRNDGRGDHDWNDHGNHGGHDHGSHDSGIGSSGGSSGSHDSSGGTPGGSGNRGTGNGTPGTSDSSHGSHDNSGGTSGGNANPGTGGGTAGTGDGSHGSHRSHGSHGSSDSNGSSNGNADGNTNDNQPHHN